MPFTTMKSANRLQQALKSSRGLAFGAWQMLPGANVARIMARAGYDWVCVDCEHGNIDDAQMHEAVAAIADQGVSPVVRVAAMEDWMVKRALDAGAHGICVPLLRTAEDARRIVEMTKFPPAGKRGFGSPFSMQTFGNPSMQEYLQQANESIVTIVQIETKEALENVDAIAKVDGVDVLLIGPFDLGNNIGHPIISEIDDELKKAIASIHKAAVDNGKRTGFFSTSGEQAQAYADEGYHFISVTTDVMTLQGGMSSVLTKAQGGYAHKAYNLAKGAVSGLASREK